MFLLLQHLLEEKKQLLLNGDVVISSANSMELVGKNILWNKDENDVSFGGFLTIVRTSNGLVLHPEFLSLIYQYLFETGYFANIATQTTNIANLTNKKLNEIPFPIPPLAEQHRIVAKLEESFAEIDRAEEAANTHRCTEKEDPSGSGDGEARPAA